MKKLAIGLFILFFLCAGVYAIVQSQIGRNLIQNALTDALQESGFSLKIERLEGTLPHQINLKGVVLTGHGIDVGAAEVSLRPTLWRLFKKEIAFHDVQAKGVSISKGEPFDFSGKFRLNAKQIHVKGSLKDWKGALVFDRKTNTALFNAQNSLLYAKGRAQLGPSWELLASNLQIGSDQLLSHLPFPAAGRLLSNIHIKSKEDGYEGRTSWQIPNLVVEGKKIGAVKGSGNITWKEKTFTGSFTIDPFAKALFELTLEPSGIITGTSEIDIANLQSLHLPQTYGKLAAKAVWKEIEQGQGVRIDAAATDFYYRDLYTQKLIAHSELTIPKLKGPLTLEAENLKWNSLNVKTTRFETALGEEEAPFNILAEGTLKHPFDLTMSGTWEENLVVEIDACSGSFLETPFQLEKQVRIEKGEETLQISETRLNMEGASAIFSLDRQKGTTNSQLRLHQVPLDFLSLNPLDVQIGGTIDLDASIKEKEDKLEGELEASLHQTAPFQADGQFKGNIEKDLLTLVGDLKVQNQPLLNIDLSIPIHLSVWPFAAEPLFHKECKGKVAVHGRVEQVLDFLDIGPHRLEGECEGEFEFRNTLYRPLLEGRLFFKNGTYENYYSGTDLQEINAEFFAEKNVLYLRRLTALDRPGSGSLTATGQIHLLQSDLYPFLFNIDLNDLQFVQIDLVDALANGKVRIEGNALSAVAKGDLLIQKCALTIPDHIPRPLPNLEVVYRNPTHPFPPPEKEYKPYPLYLALHVSAPTDVTISGRGLNSEWKGDFHLGGTYSSLAAKGKLELIKGEFNFSTRSFKLTEGSLSLSGIEHQMPHLNIAATTETKGIQITARISGPLDDPQIVLQSSPPLPLGSIMSYLLFGQDISEIGGFQALQIATSLASLAGTGADVMEDTRKSLGVDRLRVISDPTEEGGETVSLEVGKYVSEGVLVTLSQGTEESSTNIRVEIELKNNFVFQIESDQHQEQGKFTLKWNLNY